MCISKTTPDAWVSDPPQIFLLHRLCGGQPAEHQPHQVGNAQQCAAASAKIAQLLARGPALITAGTALWAAHRAAFYGPDGCRQQLGALAKQDGCRLEHAPCRASLD